ncbi:MAG TPA: type II toxin-antitoxin system PemK/MazF family toxin [Candidatus Brocadiaceae bacterium]|nr:type II toxin-antitoxin system PemK/MazF family toxin [Candidatus Brocadiaceae bacterium]
MINYNLGDIALIGFPHTDLQHTSKRPALVLYDSGDQDILVARVTTQQYLTKTDYKILNWEKSGLLTESYIRLGKLATIKKQYVVKHLGKLETFETDNIKSILEKMFLL